MKTSEHCFEPFKINCKNIHQNVIYMVEKKIYSPVLLLIYFFSSVDRYFNAFACQYCFYSNATVQCYSCLQLPKKNTWKPKSFFCAYFVRLHRGLYCHPRPVDHVLASILIQERIQKEWGGLQVETKLLHLYWFNSHSSWRHAANIAWLMHI